MSGWELYRALPGEEVRWAVRVDPRGEEPPASGGLVDRLTGEALLRAGLVLERLGNDESEVFRAVARDGTPLDVVAVVGGPERLLLLAPARPHSSGLARLAFVYSSLARSRDAVVFCDASGAILGASRRWRELYGFPLAAVLGANPRLINSRRHSRAFFQQLWRDLLDRRIGSWSGELVNRRHDGELIDVWQTITTFLDSEGEIAGYLGMTRDLSPHVEAMRRLGRTKEDSGRIAGLHEQRLRASARALRSPLLEIGASLDLAEAAAADPAHAAVGPHLDGIRRAAARLEEILSQLEGNRPTTTQTSASPISPISTISRFSLRALVRTETELQRALARCREVHFELTERGPSLPCFADEVEILEAVRVLLAHAVARSWPGRTVRVAVETWPEGHQEVIVDDEGSALTASERERALAFDARPEVDESSLSFARDAAERNGGSLSIGESPAGGCRTTLRLPMVRELFDRRAWAVAVYDPGEALWSRLSAPLSALAIPCFLAHNEKELDRISRVELPNLILCVAGREPIELPSIPGAPGEEPLSPALARFAPPESERPLTLLDTKGPAALAAEILALLEPAR